MANMTRTGVGLQLSQSAEFGWYRVRLLSGF